MSTLLNAARAVLAVMREDTTSQVTFSTAEALFELKEAAQNVSLLVQPNAFPSQIDLRGLQQQKAWLDAEITEDRAEGKVIANDPGEGILNLLDWLEDNLDVLELIGVVEVQR